MKQGVLLISMPFAGVSMPSLALSLLKAVVRERAEIDCDILYLNMAFRNFTGRPHVYDRVCTYGIFGEWPFGEDLFGARWVEPEEGKHGFPDSPLPMGVKDVDSVKSDLLFMRACVRSFLDEWMASIPWDRYGVVGFTSVFFQQVASLALARRIKEAYPEKIIAFGGANFNEATDKALLRLFPFIDWVFCGQADCSFPEAVRNWLRQSRKTVEGIPGISYRTNGGIVSQGSGDSPNMDCLPLPDFHEYVAGLEKWVPDVSKPTLCLEFSRGCWWGRKSQCIFCGLNHRDLSFHSKSPERAELEIKTVIERYGIGRICITDSILHTGYFKTLLPALAQRGENQSLFVETKANLTRKQVGILKSAGVHQFQPGIESLDTELLAHMRKGTTLLKNVQLLKWAREYNVQPFWNLLYGFPGENRTAYARMTDVLPMLFHLHPPSHCAPVKLQRFSVLFDHGAHWGIGNVTAAKAYSHIYPFSQNDLDEIACYFSWDFEGKNEIPVYTEPLRESVGVWQNEWNAPEPPMLAFMRRREKERGEYIIIHDSRPCAMEFEIELDSATSAIYLFCDSRKGFEELAASLPKRMGKSYPGRAALRIRLDELVEKRLMLREGDYYLSLANDMEIMGRKGGSMLAALFLSEEGSNGG